MRGTEKQPTEIELNRLVLDYRRKINNTPLEQIQWRRDNTPLEQIQEDLMTLLDGQVNDETITAACQIAIDHSKNFVITDIKDYTIFYHVQKDLINLLDGLVHDESVMIAQQIVVDHFRSLTDNQPEINQNETNKHSS